MQNWKLDSNSKVYILCPAHFRTGGTELLHQLAKEIGKYRECYIYYIKRFFDNPIPDDFKDYEVKYVNVLSSKDRINENVIIIPETVTDYISEFRNMKIMIWWLSVDNFGMKNLNLCEKVIREISGEYYSFFRDRNKFLHLVQSKYAYDYLIGKGISRKRIKYLTDYINNDFLFLNDTTTLRKDVVLYNPKKGNSFTKKIIGFAKEIKFIPIINMNRSQVRELMSVAKVYIDFGNHPGKDRIPREAALSGMCIITGTSGSAKNSVDISIPSKYKFETKEKNIPYITECIKDLMNNFDDRINDFQKYIDIIKNERIVFENEVKELFSK